MISNRWFHLSHASEKGCIAPPPQNSEGIRQLQAKSRMDTMRKLCLKLRPCDQSWGNIESVEGSLFWLRGDFFFGSPSDTLPHGLLEKSPFFNHTSTYHSTRKDPASIGVLVSWHIVYLEIHSPKTVGIWFLTRLVIGLMIVVDISN